LGHGDSLTEIHSTIDKDCRNLQPGQKVCIGTTDSPIMHGPQPQMPGTIATCKKYYLVKPDDNCWLIERDNRISHADFAKWNPAINSACGNLALNVNVCIAA
jgi:hypothetical protein